MGRTATQVAERFVRLASSMAADGEDPALLLDWAVTRTLEEAREPRQRPLVAGPEIAALATDLTACARTFRQASLGLPRGPLRAALKRAADRLAWEVVDQHPG